MRLRWRSSKHEVVIGPPNIPDLIVPNRSAKAARAAAAEEAAHEAELANAPPAPKYVPSPPTEARTLETACGTL